MGDDIIEELERQRREQKKPKAKQSAEQQATPVRASPPPAQRPRKRIVVQQGSSPGLGFFLGCGLVSVTIVIIVGVLIGLSFFEYLLCLQDCSDGWFPVDCRSRCGRLWDAILEMLG